VTSATVARAGGIPVPLPVAATCATSGVVVCPSSPDVRPVDPRRLQVQTKSLPLTNELPCHLPATWDQVAVGFASGMGPPPLPVMGPP